VAAAVAAAEAAAKDAAAHVTSLRWSEQQQWPS